MLCEHRIFALNGKIMSARKEGVKGTAVRRVLSVAMCWIKLEKKLRMLENIELRPRWFRFGYRLKMGDGSFPLLKEASKEKRIRYVPFAVHLLFGDSGGA